MTRQTAIKILAGFFGGLTQGLAQSIYPTGVAIGGIGSGQLMHLSFGDPVKSDAQLEREHEDCLKSRSEPRPDESVSGGCFGSLDTTRELIPGTAKLTINLDGWKGIEVTHGKETRFISREELWDALR